MIVRIRHNFIGQQDFTINTKRKKNKQTNKTTVHNTAISFQILAISNEIKAYNGRANLNNQSF